MRLIVLGVYNKRNRRNLTAFIKIDENNVDSCKKALKNRPPSLIRDYSFLNLKDYKGGGFWGSQQVDCSILRECYL